MGRECLEIMAVMCQVSRVCMQLQVGLSGVTGRAIASPVHVHGFKLML